ncbi:MAG: hypothetical protein PHY64_12775 [Eubacteriales bacterium]|nr:hypothetical protein [Eubacteriales bacterium]MDD3214541.1 hypothetical protein [Eubacteriales bacterium]
MNRLKQLPQIADHQLGGLNADPRLLAKIKIAASEGPRRRVRLRPLLLGALAATLCLCVGLWAIPAYIAGSPSGASLLSSGSAGVSINGAEVRVRALDVPAGSISVGGTGKNSATYRNIFAQEKNGNYPLVMVGNAVYRLLISPTNMSDSLLGESLGEVTEYTVEPALSTGGIVSNIVSAGETVYAVQNMKGAMAAAYVNGSLRVFQRVSFAGAAALGGETLKDTLTASQSVVAMELTDSGIVDDSATAQTLLSTLYRNAGYQNASFGSDDSRSLLLALDNGLIVQLMVGSDTVSACGTWSAPEFFTAFDEAVAAE